MLSRIATCCKKLSDFNLQSPQDEVSASLLSSSLLCRFPLSKETFRDVFQVMPCFPCRNLCTTGMELMPFPRGFCEIYRPKAIKPHRDRN